MNAKRPSSSATSSDAPSSGRPPEARPASARHPAAPTRILKAGILYFAIVFGAGFALGTVRVLWAVPRFGTRLAELLEAPVMLVVIVLAAQWVVRRLVVPAGAPARLIVGLTGLGLLLGAEFMLVVQVRGLSLDEYMASRDPWSAAVYYMMLGVFAVLPMAVARKARGRPPEASAMSDASAQQAGDHPIKDASR